MNVAGGPGFSRYEVLMLVARLSFVTATCFFSLKWIINQLDPDNKQKRKAKKKAEEQIRKLASDAVALTRSIDLEQLTD